MLCDALSFCRSDASASSGHLLTTLLVQSPPTLRLSSVSRNLQFKARKHEIEAKRRRTSLVDSSLPKKVGGVLHVPHVHLAIIIVHTCCSVVTNMSPWDIQTSLSVCFNMQALIFTDFLSNRMQSWRRLPVHAWGPCSNTAETNCSGRHSIFVLEHRASVFADEP